METGKDLAVDAAVIASDTFWGADNILTGGIFNNTDFMQGVVQRNNALYEGLYQTTGELTGKFMYYGTHPDEGAKDAGQAISDYRQQREVLFTQGQYEEAGRRDGKLGTEAALFAAPAVVGAVKLARAGRVAEVGRVVTAGKEGTLAKTAEKVSDVTEQSAKSGLDGPELKRAITPKVDITENALNKANEIKIETLDQAHEWGRRHYLEKCLISVVQQIRLLLVLNPAFLQINVGEKMKQIMAMVH